ncbi:unnamed protein product, partial [Symbiodinium necroappetens]
ALSGGDVHTEPSQLLVERVRAVRVRGLPVVVPVDSDEELIPDPVPEPVAMMVPEPRDEATGKDPAEDDSELHDLRVCLVVHELSGYSFGIPFATGEDPMKVARAINAELSFAGVQGQHMVLRMDNESTLQALWNRAGKVSDHAYGKNATATPHGYQDISFWVQRFRQAREAVEMMSAFRPDLPYVYPEDLVIQAADSGDLIERGTGDRDILDDEDMDDYSPDVEDVFPEEIPPDGPPVGENEAPPEFDVDMQPAEDDDPMEVAISWLQDHALYALCSRPDMVRAAKGSEETRNQGLEFTLKFGGSKVKVQVPSGAADEYSGELLDEKKLGEGMKLEMEELDNFGVCQVVSEKEALRLVREAKRRVLSTRWVLHYKDGHKRVRCRLVVRDFKGPTSALSDGIYSPTTTLESVRCLLGMYAHFGGKVISGDISVAFMQARLFSTEVVKLPENCSTTSGERVHCLLKRAMNGLRIGPLAWFRELGETLRKLGFQVTADSTVYRKMIREKGIEAIVLVLAYVDDILVFSTVASVAEKVFADLSKVFKMKRTGTLEPKKPSVISFLGRNIYQKEDGSLFFGLKPGMLKSCAEEYQITKSAKLPKLERLWMNAKATPITHEAYQRYRRVLGKLSWMALTRPDLQFVVGFLARSQSNPDSRKHFSLGCFSSLSLRDSQRM